MTALTVATLLWEPNDKSLSFSRCYSEEWVEKLYRGFSRNLSAPIRFVLFTDRQRPLPAAIKQVVEPTLGNGGYGDCIRPYRMGVPMILCGLDTVVTGNCDELTEYCLSADRIALPRDPYRPHIACNGVALVPAGWERIGTDHRGENDMDWCRSFPHAMIDDLFPGQVQSYKGFVEKNGLRDTRICYFHGERKPHQLAHVPFIRECWV